MSHDCGVLILAGMPAALPCVPIGVAIRTGAIVAIRTGAIVTPVVHAHCDTMQTHMRVEEGLYDLTPAPAPEVRESTWWPHPLCKPTKSHAAQKKKNPAWEVWELPPARPVLCDLAYIMN